MSSEREVSASHSVKEDGKKRAHVMKEEIGLESIDKEKVKPGILEDRLTKKPRLSEDNEMSYDDSQTDNLAVLSLLALGSAKDSTPSSVQQATKPNGDSRLVASELSAAECDTQPGLTPRTLDILCGRGRGFFQHPGNRRMLQIVDKHKPRYRNAGKIDKTAIVKLVTDEIQLEQVRFLKKHSDKWVEVSALEAHKKVCHCLREEKLSQDASDSSSDSLDDSSTKAKGSSLLQELSKSRIKKGKAAKRKAEKNAKDGSKGSATKDALTKDAASSPAAKGSETKDVSMGIKSELLDDKTSRAQGLACPEEPSEANLLESQARLVSIEEDLRASGSLATVRGIVMGEPYPMDILFGNEQSFDKHPGNIHLRNSIQMVIGASSTTQEQKRTMAKGIVAELRLAGSRFLTKNVKGSTAVASAVWYDVNNVEAESMILRNLEDEESKLQALLQQPASSHPDDINSSAVVANQDAGDETAPSEEGETVKSQRVKSSRSNNVSDSGSESEKEQVDGSSLVPTPNDVICGRGRGNFRHPGNRRLLRLFQDSKASYRAANKKDKTEIGRKVIYDIKARGGRFLKKDDDGQWQTVSDKDALRKVCHGIRDIPKDAVELENAASSSDEESGPPNIQIRTKCKSPVVIPAIPVAGIANPMQMTMFGPHSPAAAAASQMERLARMNRLPGMETNALTPATSAPFTAPQTAQSQPGKQIRGPRDIDVVLGRGRGNFGHLGNRRMLEIIHRNKGRYRKGTKSEKGQVAKEILSEVQSNGARFLRRKDNDEWEIVPYKDALNKVCHGIRDSIANNTSGKMPQSPRNQYNQDRDDTRSPSPFLHKDTQKVEEEARAQASKAASQRGLTDLLHGPALPSGGTPAAGSLSEMDRQQRLMAGMAYAEEMSARSAILNAQAARRSAALEYAAVNSSAANPFLMGGGSSTSAHGPMAGMPGGAGSAQGVYADMLLRQHHQQQMPQHNRLQALVARNPNLTPEEALLLARFHGGM